MQVINFFDKLFAQFGNLMSFMDSQITIPSLYQTFVNVSHGINSNGFVTLSVWNCLSTGLVAFLGVMLAYHLWHLIKLIG